MTRWSPWLRLDSEAWEGSLIREELLPELDFVAREAKAAWEKRASPEQIGDVFKRLFAACRGQPGESQDRKATVALMLRYLCGYPAEVLSASADEWIVTKVFMPAIAELREICDRNMRKLERAWRRAETLAERSRWTHDSRRTEGAREREIAEANARMTPERWAETERLAREIIDRPKVRHEETAARIRLRERREQMRDRIEETLAHNAKVKA